MDHVCIWSYSSSSVWRPFAILIIVVVIKQSHSFFWIWRTFICMSMLAIIDNDISFCRPDHLCCPLWCHQCCLRSPHHSGGFTVVWRYYDTYIAILVMVSMIHSYINALIHFYDKSLSTLQNNARCLPIFLALTPSPMHLACSFFSRWPPHL